MASYPLAVLKFSWADTPYTNDRPNGLTYSDVVVNRAVLPSLDFLVGHCRLLAVLQLRHHQSARHADISLAQACRHAPSASNPQDAGSSAQSIGGKWPWCVLFESSNHDFYAHEFGHARGFKHVWGPPPGGGVALPGIYQDPYCIMAAQTYQSTMPTFALPADLNGPPSGDAPHLLDRDGHGRLAAFHHPACTRPTTG